MKLSTRSRYGLRAMIFIARNGAQVLSSELIAENEDISKKYLDRILMRLREAGLLPEKPYSTPKLAFYVRHGRRIVRTAA